MCISSGRTLPPSWLWLLVPALVSCCWRCRRVRCVTGTHRSSPRFSVLELGVEGRGEPRELRVKGRCMSQVSSGC